MTDVKTTILFIGDPHFKVKNVEFITLFTSRVCTFIESTNPDFVVIGGDLLDNHDRIDVEPLNLALTFVESVSQKSKTFILVGNHDYKNNQQFLSNNHWMNAMKQWPNVTIVDNIVEYKHCNQQYLFVPYVPPGRFVEAIKTKIADFSGFDAVFAHQEFYGCKMGPIESKVGDRWKKSWPLVISGHIHNKQWPQPNIYYPGSAMQHAFGQSVDNTISLLTFFTENVEVEELDLKMPRLIIKYVRVNDLLRPLKIKNTNTKKYKLVVKGTNEEFQSFKKNNLYKQLLEQGFKFAFKLDELTINTVNIEPQKRFVDILLEKVKQENDLELELVCNNFLIN